MDCFVSVHQTADGGFLLAVCTGGQLRLTKTSSAGELLWVRTFDGFAADCRYSIQPTTDGGFLLAVCTGGQLRVTKISWVGEPVWIKQVAEPIPRGCGNSLEFTSDGGYIVAGCTSPAGGGNEDAYVVRLDPQGNRRWEKILGGSGNDCANAVRETADGGYIVAGWSESFGAGDRDVYLVKLAPEERPFRRGDSNDDGKLDLADPVANLAYQFLGQSVPCLDACDFDDSGELDVTDPIANLTHQFLGGPPPSAPGKDVCGVDPTEDELGCDSFTACPADG